MPTEPSRLWLVFMTSSGKEQDLREMCAPILPYIDGVVAVFHAPPIDGGATYLESIKGQGEIIYTRFCQRHAFSRNHYLWSGPIRDGDWCLQLDDLERLATPFAAALRSTISTLESRGVNTVFYYNKAFLYRWHESLEFVGSPHEGLRRHDGQMRAIELSTYHPVESEVRYSVRHLKRTDPKGWVDHYFRYWVEYPWGSNHALLGNVNRGDEMAIFRERETQRNAFRDELARRGVARTVAAVLDHWRSVPLDSLMRGFVNGDKVLNDAYRHHILNDQSTIDEHEWTSLKPV